MISVLFVNYFDVDDAFTENIKLVFNHLCKCSDGLLVIGYLVDRDMPRSIIKKT